MAAFKQAVKILQTYRQPILDSPIAIQLAKEFSFDQELKELRGTIPWSVFEQLMPKVIRRLAIRNFWGWIAAKLKAGYKNPFETYRNPIEEYWKVQYQRTNPDAERYIT